jgi:hypothetical protein
MNAAMTPADFRRIALSLEGAEEGSHMGVMDFRVEGKIFATLAHRSQGYGNLMLTTEQQKTFVAEAPNIFLPVAGGWGKKGATHIVLARASEDLLTGAIRSAWKSRVERNSQAGKKRSGLTREHLEGARRSVNTRSGPRRGERSNA